MKKQIKKLYICHTYYHLLIAIVKQIKSNATTDIILASDAEYNPLLNDEKLLKNLKESNLFNNIIIFDYQKYIKKCKFFCIKQMKLVNKIIKEKKYNFDDYDNIYIFNERTVIGTLLNKLKIFYNLLEDGTNCYKNKYKDIMVFSKNKLRRKIKELYKVYEIADSPYIKSIEVNDKEDIWLDSKKVVETPKEKMFESLTKSEKKRIVKIFINNEKEICNIKETCLVLTQPLNEGNYCKSEEEKINLYKKIIEEYAKDENVIIKVHPREKTDYKKYFKNNKKIIIITEKFPIEIINFLPIKIKKTITISSTAIEYIKNSETNILIGNECLEKNVKSKVNNNIVMKSGIWYMMSNILVKILSFITIPIFTRLLTQNEFGQFNNYNSWLQIISVFLTLNVHSSLISAKYDYKGKYEEFILSMFCLSSISILIWTIIFNLFDSFFTSYFDLNVKYINFIVIYLFFNSAFQFVQLRARMLYEYKSNVFLNIINSVSTSLLSVILVLIMNDKLQGRIMGIIISIMIVGIYSIFKIIKKGRKFKISYWSYALKICLPYIPHSLAGILLLSLDKIMVTKMFGTEKTAIISIAYNCCMIILLVYDSFNNAFAPWLGDQINEKNFDVVKKISKKYMTMFFILVFGMMLITPEILWVMGGKTYQAAKYILVPTAISFIFHFLYSLFINVEQFKKKTLIMSIASLSAAVLNYILNIFFLTKFGYSAAPYVKVISYIWLLIIHMLIVYKIGYSKLYDYKFVIKISILIILLSFVIDYSYSHIFLRVILIIIYSILFIHGLLKTKCFNIKELLKKY